MPRGFWGRRWPVALLVMLAAALTTAGDWPTYLHDVEHTANSPDETILSTANVPQLAPLWTFQAGGVIAASPTIVSNTVYVGSWDGNEYALDAATGALKWKSYLGQTGEGCPITIPSYYGITSAATVQGNAVYVAGGGTYWDALDATTGAVLWRVFTGDNSQAGGYYNWDSPLIYGGYAYIGLASRNDCPMVQGKLLQVSLATHNVVRVFNMVPNGEGGGGVWTAPSIDPHTNTLYLSTGTQGTGSAADQALSIAVVALDATTLSLKSSWQVPNSDQVADSDWGNTPILFTDAGGRKLVASLNKNGYLYAFDRTNLAAGPLWQTQATIGGPRPSEGDASVSSGAFANGMLYMAGGNTTINGVVYAGSVRAFNPATGSIIWEHASPGFVIPSLAAANGFVVDGAGSYLEVLDAAIGTRLYSYPVAGTIYSLSLANGRIYAGTTAGLLYAFALPQPPPPPTPTPQPDANCPLGWVCQDVGAPAVAGSESSTAAGLQVTAGGTGIGGTSDQFRFLARSVTGDTQVTTQVAGQMATPAGAQAGVMVRQSSAPTASFYAAFLTPNRGVVVQYRAGPGRPAITALTPRGAATTPLWLRIQRVGDALSAATSPDNETYTLVAGSQATVVMPASIVAGLAVSAHDPALSTTATFTGTTIASPSPPPATPTAVPDPACPAGWQCGDIGTFVPPGSESLNGGTWTLSGAGQLQGGGNYDELHYVWQPLTGDTVVATRLIAQTTSAPRGQASLMMRGSTDPTAPFYSISESSDSYVDAAFRAFQGGFIRTAVGRKMPPGPLYLRITRVGSLYTGAFSTDGQTWNSMQAAAQTIAMPTTALVGLAVASNAPGVLNTAQFDRLITVTRAPTPTPTATPGP